MKCRILILLIVALPFCASAQNRETIDSLAKEKLWELLDSWNLGISDSADMDIEVYNKFKLLFDSTASIDDDLNAVYKYGGYKKPGTYSANGKPVPFDIYAHDVALSVLIKSITVDSGSIAPSAFDADKPMQRKFRLMRNISFQKTGKYVLPDTYADTVMKSRSIKPQKDSLQASANLTSGIKKSEDSVYRFTSKEALLVTMSFSPGANTVLITGITAIQNEVACTNDADGDAITDNLDSLPKSSGDFTAAGKPDYDLDGVADMEDKCYNTFGISLNKGCPISYFYTNNGFDASVGFQVNSANINLPALNQLGYVVDGKDAMDVLQSKQGSLYNPGQTGSVYAGGNYIHYFGQKKKKAGISIGISYAGFTASYAMKDSILYTYEAYDKGGLPYRRQVKFDALSEDIKYRIFNLPVMFNYRWHPGRKNNSVFKVQAGPSLMLFSNKSSYNTTIDFGGIYQIDLEKHNSITYYSPFDNTSPYNVFITADSINGQSANPGADYIFQQLDSTGFYDFANDKNYNGNQNLHRFAVAFNAGFDLQQKISDGLTLKLGATFVYAPLPERKEKYIPIDKTADDYQSIYQSTAKSFYSAYGIHVGFVYNW